MHHVANFLGSRDLLAMTWTCARMRMVSWDAIVAVRFPRKIQQPEFIKREPRYCAREFLLLLEDRAKDERAAEYYAKARIAREDFEDPQMRTIICVGTSNAINDVIQIPRDCLPLRGDIIIDDNTALSMKVYFIFDGVFACQCRIFGLVDMVLPHVTLPPMIKIGVEFDIMYYGSFVSLPDPFQIYLDTDMHNITYNLIARV